MTQINHLGNFDFRSVPIERYNSRMDTKALVAELDEEIDRLQKVRALLLGHTAPLKRGRPPATKRRTMSPEGRARIVAAQKLRWANKK
jgi:hypothetical protein